MKMVQIGMTGNTVRQLQQALVNQGYELDIDGDFGDGTDAALRDFQANNDLDVDGVAGPATWAALGVDDGEPAKSGHHSSRKPLLEQGSEGDAVRVLQTALVELGWEIDIDGDFGPATDEAVREFQDENDLDVDGVVGPNTWVALGF